jgi:glycosyltransferase involved in cell wall biosynthesis
LAAVRIAVYTDYPYHRIGEEIYAERAFALFLGRLRGHFDRLLLAGRLAPASDQARYPVGEGVELLGLPYYPSLAQPLRALPHMGRGLAIFWRALDDVDCVWLLGPHPLAVAFALLALLRRRRVVLGVRQDMPAYVRSRRPGQWALILAALALEGAWRLLARFLPVVVVGPELARRYRASRRLHEVIVSLVEEGDLVPLRLAERRAYDGELRVLSVGRLDAEKNPLLLADILARLEQDGDRRWRLVVCGEGTLADELRRRLEELGLAERAELRGYVPFGEELFELYRSSHLLLHVSLTEGMPQVLVEALAAGLPVVATDVGGIGGAVGGAVALIPPADVEAAAAALRALAADSERRRDQLAAGHAWAAAHTAEREVQRLASFLAGQEERETSSSRAKTM